MPPSLSKSKESSARSEEKFIYKSSSTVVENIMVVKGRARAQVRSWAKEDEEFILNTQLHDPDDTRKQTCFVDPSAISQSRFQPLLITPNV
jgi:hypothetical protein